MPKSNRGGKTNLGTVHVTLRQPQFHPVNNPRPTPQAAPQPTPTPAPNPIQQNQPSASFDAFRKMTDDQKADVIMQAQKTQVPVFLAQNDLQRVLYGLKLNDKPTLVDDSVLDSTPGKELFRTVNATNDQANRIKYTAVDVANQVIKGSVTRVSDTGGSVYGRGIYFADDYRGSVSYGNRMGSVNQTAVIRAKISPTARTIGAWTADSNAQAEISSGSKLGKALSRLQVKDQSAVWALAKGYDAMVAPNGYHVIINRSVLIASRDIKAAGSKWK